MSPSKTYESQDVEVDIWYWKPRADGSVPIEAEAVNIMLGDPRGWRPEGVTVHDIRSAEDEFTLAKTGL
jgi:hypothetical protein